MEKVKELYKGKAKTLFTTSQADRLIAHFRDDASAFDGVKKAKLARKGIINNYFNAFIMRHLSEHNIPNHFIDINGPDESVVKNLTMFPIECVVRNIAAGSICKRLGVKEGLEFSPPTFEFFLKDDDLHDPMINEYHIRSLHLADDSSVARMKELTFQVNNILKELFAKQDLLLVDYKLEFGKDKDGKIYLGDEFSPDGARIWDAKTKKKLDKDRFRFDMGDVLESYEIVTKKLGIVLP